VKNANPVSWCSFVLAAAVFTLGGCSKDKSAHQPSIPNLPAWDDKSSTPQVVQYSYDIIATWPHDRGAFTQGLLYRNGSLLESTGLNGSSSLREVDLATGRAVKQVTVAPAYFAEGLAVIGDRAFQLTWQNHRGFIYNADTFQQLGEFNYEGEGWGLTTDGRHLIMSDGTNRLRFLDPQTFALVRTVEVTLNGKPETRLNELEYINGEIFANVWQTDLVVRIDATTGVVRGVIDFTGLLTRTERTTGTDVLNGIAYDPATGRLFVTGKRWPSLFEVRLKALP